MGELFETFLHPDINVELAFNTFFKEFIDSFWTKHFKKILVMLTFTRLIPLVAQNLLLLYPVKQMFIITLIISTLIFGYELKSLILLGPVKHFDSFMNYVDFFGHGAGIIWLSCMY